MSLTPKINIPSLYQETRTGLTPRADYRTGGVVNSASDKFQGRDAVGVPGNVLRRIKQEVNNPANKGVNS